MIVIDPSEVRATSGVIDPPLYALKWKSKYNLWFLYIFEDECKKWEFSKKEGSALPGPRKFESSPLRQKKIYPQI